MAEHVCVKEEVINDLKDKIKELSENDREGYGMQKELSATIKLLAESNTDLKSAIIEISNTLVKVNTNMDLMANEIKETNTRLDKVENKLQDESDKNKIDIREIEKEEVKSTFKQKAKKVLIPTGIFAGIASFIIAVADILKGLKVIK